MTYAGRFKLSSSDRSNPYSKGCAHAIICACTKLPLGSGKVEYSCMATGFDLESSIAEQDHILAKLCPTGES